MVRYKTEADDREQRALAEISLNTPNNLKRRKVTSVVSAVSVSYMRRSPCGCSRAELKPTAFYFLALRWFFC